MRRKVHRHWAWLIALACMGCANRDRLVVYADPWMEDYAMEMVADFQLSHPSTDVDLKVLSSEVIAQHIHYGQPVDVFLCFGKSWIAGAKDWVGEERALAGTRLVEVGPRNPDLVRKQDALGGSGCIVIEASDRPLRRLSDIWMRLDSTEHRCTLVANFQRQMEDYLLRGWVSRGLVPEHFAKANAGQLIQYRQGAWFSGVFSGILLQDAPHPDLAREFFEQLGAEKSKETLGRLGYLP
ncbi:MAG: substrate-binding domain-containing protein [Bacteroidia bacterium]